MVKVIDSTLVRFRLLRDMAKRALDEEKNETGGSRALVIDVVERYEGVP